jgi:hypothetical protein
MDKMEGKENCPTNLKVQQSKHGQIPVATISILNIGVACCADVCLRYIRNKQKKNAKL